MLPSSSSRPSLAAAFTEQQLKQLRAQCLVILAFRNNMMPQKKHLEIALGEGECPAQGSSGGGGGDGRGADGDGSRGETGSSSSSPVSFSAATAGLPLPDLLGLSSLRLSSSPQGGRTRRVIRRGVGKIQR
ncbi:chromatin structure-remodeling complex protein SYD-like [Panicum miliaceum]|uniref:Chromatin structure-remodeling complex protein SYD-like n=1 Tax=Panicum miliaceum TaxID=4540 RepID=A0A3L6Q2N7_PANMI|nr:chromatin structure-remodeling complex protein SYD-like [Panicum miliaceum]